MKTVKVLSRIAASSMGLVFSIACSGPVNSSPVALANTTSGSSEAQEGLGFYPAINSTVLPTPVLESSSSVVEVWVTNPKKFIQPNSISEFRKSLIETQNENFRQRMLKRMNLLELEKCESLGMVDGCSVTTQIYRGSGVIVHGDTLVTARHNFQLNRTIFPFLSGLQKVLNKPLYSCKGKCREDVERNLQKFIKAPFQGNLLFMVTNQNEELVFTSNLNNFQVLRYGNLQGSIQGATEYSTEGNISVPKLKNFESKNSAPKTFYDDLVVVQLPIRATKIEIATGNCQPGEMVYGLGFPSETRRRSKFGARDAKDREFSFSIGRILNKAEVIQRSSKREATIRIIEEIDFTSLAFSSADMTPGMSGGALFNKEGQLCGIRNIMYPAIEDEEFEKGSTDEWMRYSFGVSAKQIGQSLLK